MADHIRELLANNSVLQPDQGNTPQPISRVSMSPPSADAAQTPEPKSTGGLASVFKSLTGGRSASTRSPHPHSSASPQSPLPHSSGVVTNAIYGGPSNFEKLHEQLKAENYLPDRIAAAVSLRYVVQDYPISGVSGAADTGNYLLIIFRSLAYLRREKT